MARLPICDQRAKGPNHLAKPVGRLSNLGLCEHHADGVREPALIPQDSGGLIGLAEIPVYSGALIFHFTHKTP